MNPGTIPGAKQSEARTQYPGHPVPASDSTDERASPPAASSEGRFAEDVVDPFETSTVVDHEMGIWNETQVPAGAQPGGTWASDKGRSSRPRSRSRQLRRQSAWSSGSDDIVQTRVGSALSTDSDKLLVLEKRLQRAIASSARWRRKYQLECLVSELVTRDGCRFGRLNLEQIRALHWCPSFILLESRTKASDGFLSVSHLWVALSTLVQGASAQWRRSRDVTSPRVSELS